MNFKPNYYYKRENLRLISELKECVDELQNIDVESHVDDDIEDRTFIKGLQKSISKPADSAQNMVLELKNNLICDISENFAEKIELYQFMVINKMEEDVFPFSDWIRYVSKIENDHKVNISLDNKMILRIISNLMKVNADLGKENFKDYFSEIKKNLKEINSLFPLIIDMIKEEFPNANILDVFSATDFNELDKGLNGNHVSLKENSDLFYIYAASIPNISWTFKNVIRNTNNVSSSSFDEIFEEFSKTDVWKRISEREEFKEKFIEQAFNEKFKYPIFWEDAGSGFSKKLLNPNWNSVNAFVKHLTKENIGLAESIVSKIFSRLPKSKHDEYSAQAVSVVNMALHEKLQKEMNISDVKEKKYKL